MRVVSLHAIHKRGRTGERMEIGIVGYGAIGRALTRLFVRPQTHQVYIYDKFIERYSSPAHLSAIDRCDIVFIAVPTPYDEALGKCDVSSVLEMVGSVSAPVCVK